MCLSCLFAHVGGSAERGWRLAWGPFCKAEAVPFQVWRNVATTRTLRFKSMNSTLLLNHAINLKGRIYAIRL